MIFGYFILLISVMISAIAAYYSVAGLTAIFSAAVIPVIVMGGALEAGKIVATVWLHNNWKRAGVAFKLYLIPAIVFLMLLTSMGIFGFLSKAHSDQSLVSGDSIAKVAIYDEKIKVEKDNISTNRKALEQLNSAVDQIMSRSTDEKGASKASQLRQSQTKERTRLLAEIDTSNKKIAALNEQRAPLAADLRKVESEVGPIKYIAALIYGDEASQNMLEAAVRWVIILIVIVFDPLALTLILAANKQLEWARKGKGAWVHDEEESVEEKPAVDKSTVVDAEPIVQKVATESTPTEQPEHPLTEEEREKKELEEVERFFWRGKMIARALDADEAERIAREGNEAIAIAKEQAEVDEFLEENWKQIAEDLAAAEARAKEAEERELEAAREQQELLDQLASEFDAMQGRLEQSKNTQTDLEAQLAQAEQIKADLKSAFDGTSNEANTLRSDNTRINRELTVANQTVNMLRLRLDESNTEQAKLKEWVDQLQLDLQAAIALASERNARINEMIEAERQVEPFSVQVEEVVEQVAQAEPLAVTNSNPADNVPIVEEAKEHEHTGAGDFNEALGFEERYFGHKYPAATADNDVPDSGMADFGASFPPAPAKGDVYLRVDYLPSKLYKFNGTRWIEIDKTSNDRLAYNEAYIQHLIEKVRTGEYDIDDVSDTERAEIEQFLKNNGTTL